MTAVPDGQPSRGGHHEPPGATPRVTVITIFLDPGAFLQEAIDSVLGQSFVDLDYVLVDDGSTDGSSEIARRVAAEHPGRVRYLQHPGHANLGMSRSRNAGLRVARGEFVAFLDADDVWLPDALARQVARLDAAPDAAMVIGGTTIWHSWASAVETDQDQWLGIEGLASPPTLARQRLHQRSNAPSTNAALARRRAVEEVGGFEAGFAGMYEDQAFFFKFFLAHPVLVHAEVVDRYRQHPASACALGVAEGTYDPDAHNPARQRFRRFALEHVRGGTWAGTSVHREARWLYRWDRWPRASRYLYPLRPGFLRRNARRVRRWAGRGS